MSQISSNYGGTLTAFFDERDDAEDAVSRLVEAGIPQSSIRLVPGYERDQDTGGSAQPDRKVHKGFFESLADFFMPDEDRYSYAEGLSRGGYLITVSNVPAELNSRAIDILDDEGAVDFDQREQSWKSEGWGGYSSESDYGSAGSSGGSAYSTTGSSGLESGSSSSGVAGFGAPAGSNTDTYGSSNTLGGTSSSSATGSEAGYNASTGSSGFSGSTTSEYDDLSRSRTAEEGVIPVVQEELRIGKRDVNLGRVRVRSYVVEEPVSEDVNLRNERVVLERRPVDRAIGANEADFTDRVIEAEEHAEEAVVAKTARVTEEIGIRKENESHTETVSDTVRHTEVEVEDERLDQNSLGTNRTGTTGSGSGSF